MAGTEGLLDVAVRRLMRLNQVSGAESLMESPEEQDRQRLRRLDVTNTSGDTLITVEFPSGVYFDCDGFQWKTKVFLMSSDQLLATGSTVFRHLLSPERQVLARRRFDRDRQVPQSVQFVVDLTPQMEGEESAFLVTQLSLSQNVRDWWRFPVMLDNSAHLVSGHDDHCPKHFDIPPSELEIPQRRGLSPAFIEETSCPGYKVIDDYCPIRHRVAILRLLMAITNKQLVLNSAPRVVTISAVATALDCTKVVKDSVMTWLLADHNLDFVGVNPEDALKIAWTLELTPIARAAFHVLVAEKAIGILGSGIAKPNDTWANRTLFGRARATVTEEQETCIQHAAQRLAQRADDLWNQLNGPDVHQFLGIREWPSEYPDYCDGLRKCIHIAVARATKSYQDYSYSVIDNDRWRYVPDAERLPAREIYHHLSPQQMLLTPCFWDHITKFASDRHGFLRPIHTSSLGKETRYHVLDPTVSSVIDFGVHEFFSELGDAIALLKHTWTHTEVEIPPVLRHGPMVFGLSEELCKFLPLWAGGLDDGTGGVYQSEIPDAENGAAPIGPGPGFHTGKTIANGDYAASSIGGSSATILTGTGTITTMTEGYSIQPALSQTTTAIQTDTAVQGNRNIQGDNITSAPTLLHDATGTTIQGNSTSNGQDNTSITSSSTLSNEGIANLELFAPDDSVSLSSSTDDASWLDEMSDEDDDDDDNNNNNNTDNRVGHGGGGFVFRSDFVLD